jgi:hypothetical protein
MHYLLVASSSTTSTSSSSTRIRRARVGFFITEDGEKHGFDFFVFWDASLENHILEFDRLFFDTESWIFIDSEFELVGSIV